MSGLSRLVASINPRRSFSSRLGIAISCVILLFSLLLSGIIGSISKAQSKADSGKFMAQLAYQMAENLDQGMFMHFREIEILATIPSIYNPNAPVDAKRALLEELKRAYTDYAWIGLTDTQGEVLASTGGILEGKDVSQRPWFIEGQKAINVQDVHEAKLLAKIIPNPSTNGEPIRFVDVSSPIVDQRGKFQGVLGAHLYWNWAENVRDAILEPLQDYHQLDVLIASSAGEILLAPSTPIPNLKALESFQLAKQGKKGYEVETWYNGITYLTAFAQTEGYRDYPGLGWVVLVRQPVDLAFADARSLQLNILVWGVVLGIWSGAISWWIAGRLVEPVIAIAAAADRIRVGDERVKIPVIPGKDEVARLSASVKSMVFTLIEQRSLATLNAQLEEKVRARTEKLQRLNKQLQQEIEERKQIEAALFQTNQKLQRLTILDGLTGVANRRRFDQYLTQEWRRMAREKVPLSLILCDVDYFKLYNDTYGHQAGDDCLKQVAQAISRSIKRPADLVARYGGEEFAVILPNTDEDGAICLAEMIREAVKALQIPHRASEVSNRVTLSLGVATVVPLPKTKPSKLIAIADQRLYLAKKQGRDCVIAQEQEKQPN